MAMTSSDANAISSVVVRDIIPALRRGRGHLVGATELLAGRISTFLFIGLSMAIALTSDSFGGVLGLIIAWFGALIGPVAIPMLLGMLPLFKRCGPSAALWSWTVGLIVFAVTKYAIPGQIATLGTANAQLISVISPIVASIIVFVVVGLVRPWHSTESDELVDSLSHDQPERESRRRPPAGRARVDRADTTRRQVCGRARAARPALVAAARRRPRVRGCAHRVRQRRATAHHRQVHLVTGPLGLAVRPHRDGRARRPAPAGPEEWAGYARSTAEFVARPLGPPRRRDRPPGHPRGREPVPVGEHGEISVSVLTDLFAALGLAGASGLPDNDADTAREWQDTARRLLVHATRRLQTHTAPSEPYPVPPGYTDLAGIMLRLHVAAELVRVDDRDETAAIAFAAAADLVAGDRPMWRADDWWEFRPDRPEDADTLLGRHRTPGHLLETMWMLLDAAQHVARHRRASSPTGSPTSPTTPSPSDGTRSTAACCATSTGSGGRPTGLHHDDRYETLVLETWDTKLWWVQVEALLAAVRLDRRIPRVGFRRLDGASHRLHPGHLSRPRRRRVAAGAGPGRPRPSTGSSPCPSRTPSTSHGPCS